MDVTNRKGPGGVVGLRCRERAELRVHTLMANLGVTPWGQGAGDGRMETALGELLCFWTGTWELVLCLGALRGLDGPQNRSCVSGPTDFSAAPWTTGCPDPT